MLVIHRVEGEVLRSVAASLRTDCRTPMETIRRSSRGNVLGRAVIDRQTIHVHDIDGSSR